MLTRRDVCSLPCPVPFVTFCRCQRYVTSRCGRDVPLVCIFFVAGPTWRDGMGGGNLDQGSVRPNQAGVCLEKMLMYEVLTFLHCRTWRLPNKYVTRSH